VWKKNEIDLSGKGHFFGDGLSDSSLLFPPNPTVYLFDLTVLVMVGIKRMDGMARKHLTIVSGQHEMGDQQGYHRAW
jgi:hypothetical protein